MYYPDFEDFLKKAESGNLIPVYREILADEDTPVSAFRKIDDSRYSFLLESIEGGEKWARYSFLGSNPSIVFQCKGRYVEVIESGKTTVYKDVDDPLKIVEHIMARYKPVVVEGLPRFYGGMVGYLGYDMNRHIEKLPDMTHDDLNVYDTVLIMTDTILIFDNLRHNIKVVSNVDLSAIPDPHRAYTKATERIEEIVQRLRIPKEPRIIEEGDQPVEVNSNFLKSDYLESVAKAIDHIVAGEAIQIVLSQRFEMDIEANPFDLYRGLRVINPSPYMFFLKLDTMTLAGSSPEVLVRLEEEQIELRPIAGTIPRGNTPREDDLLSLELLSDPKERAEHIMLVDLGRNDVGRIAKIGSVEVNELMVIEKYSHVMHIVSNVRGILEKGRNCFDVFRACFPAGTVSGAPKVRAMEIIEELEPTKRGPYAGAIGYFGYSGNMDLGITIRTLMIQNGKIYLQVGGGIVADSIPEKEYEETRRKAMGMVKAVEMVARGVYNDSDDR